MKRFIVAALLAGLTLPMMAQKAADDSTAWKSRMQWFKDAKLGIFIHWGIYAVDGVSESWSFHNERVPYTDYMAQAKRFTGSKWNAKDWVDLIKESGARYAVLTTKHHDGVALWNTKAGKLSTVKTTKAKKDFITPFVNELREQNLKVGLYYSLLDWSHNDYPNFIKSKPRYKIADDPKRWNRFVDFNFAQLGELRNQFNPDLWWFDGDWEQSAEDWRAPELVTFLRERNPNVVINSRVQGYGDYATPEVGGPVQQPDDPYWELCMTMNDSWGYQPKDTLFKTPYELLRSFCDCLSMGGNMLLDFGPREDGTIPEPEVAILKEFGRWTAKHHEAIYGTDRGVYKDAFQGYTTLSKDHRTLYLFIPYRPHGEVEVKGLLTKLKGARVVGSNTPLRWKIYNEADWRAEPGNLYVEIPEQELDSEITVVALDLVEPIKMYLKKEGRQFQQ